MDLDPNMVNLLVSYVANVGADATTWVAGKFRSRPKEEIESTAAGLNLSIQAQLVSSGVPESDAVAIARFLLETPILGYLLMLADTARGSEYAGLVAEEISALLFLEAEVSGSSLKIAAEVIAEVLMAVNQAPERQRVKRNTPRTQQLTGIQMFAAQDAKRLIFQNLGTPAPSDMVEFSQSVQRETLRKFSKIQLQHLDNGTEQKLEDLYVEPTLRIVDSTPNGRPISVGAALGSSARIVIQGPAGSGKSTTVRRLAATIASGFSGRLVPLVVELRKYSANQVLQPQTILDSLQSSVTLTAQQPPPNGWLEYTLMTGRGVIFFDGLDEVLNSGTRADVRDAVLAFAQIFPASSIVVTSRYTGYDLAPFHDLEWDHFGVMELTEGQVEEYATNWFRLKGGTSDSLKRVRSFVDESREFASDLRANPLMLSLLCSVYYAKGDIPRTLHELYERCADLIYQQWNTMRDIEDHRAWDKDVRPVLYRVARAVLLDSEYSSFGIPEDDLVREIREAFLENGALDPSEASTRARDTVRLWAGRAWIITAVMTEGAGKARYGFVHQSFLEYFAAIFEVRRVDSPEELYFNLRGRLINFNGWTVTQISVSVIQAWKDRGGRRFLDALLSDVPASTDLEAHALMRFAVSLVGIVAVAADQMRSMVDVSVNFVARSVQLPSGERTVLEIHERILKATANERSSLDEEIAGEEFAENELGDNGDSLRMSIRLQADDSEVIFADLAKMGSEDQVISDLFVNSAHQMLGSESQNVVAAALLLLVHLAPRSQMDGTQRAQARKVLDTPGRNWIITWLSAQLEIFDPETVVDRVPWHALLLRQDLLLVERVEIQGPQLLAPDVRLALEDPGQRRCLDSLGLAAAEAFAEGRPLPSVRRDLIRNHFVFYEPSSEWVGASNPEDLSGGLLVSLVMISKLADVAWKNPHAIGELFSDEAPEVAVNLVAAALGWGRVNESLIEQVEEPYRSTIVALIAGDWPVAGDCV